MNQALNPSSIRFPEPVSTPALPSPAKPVPAPIIPAVMVIMGGAAFVTAHYDPEGEPFGFVVTEQDVVRYLVRQSTKVYSHPLQAAAAYVRGPLAFEAWVSPLFVATREVA